MKMVVNHGRSLQSLKWKTLIVMVLPCVLIPSVLALFLTPNAPKNELGVTQDVMTRPSLERNGATEKELPQDLSGTPHSRSFPATSTKPLMLTEEPKENQVSTEAVSTSQKPMQDLSGTPHSRSFPATSTKPFMLTEEPETSQKPMHDLSGTPHSRSFPATRTEHFMHTEEPEEYQISTEAVATSKQLMVYDTEGKVEVFAKNGSIPQNPPTKAWLNKKNTTLEDNSETKSSKRKPNKTYNTNTETLVKMKLVVGKEDGKLTWETVVKTVVKTSGQLSPKVISIGKCEI